MAEEECNAENKRNGSEDRGQWWWSSKKARLDFSMAWINQRKDTSQTSAVSLYVTTATVDYISWYSSTSGDSQWNIGVDPHSHFSGVFNLGTTSSYTAGLALPSEPAEQSLMTLEQDLLCLRGLGWKWTEVKTHENGSLSHVRPFEAPGTVATGSSVLGFSGLECWSGLPFSSLQERLWRHSSKEYKCSDSIWPCDISRKVLL